MKKVFLGLVLSILVVAASIAQPTKAETIDDKVKAENPDGWKLGGTGSLNFSQAGFYQWAPGGTNSIAFQGLLTGIADYKSGNHLWQNRLAMEYGIQKLKGLPFRKNADRLDYFTKYGYRISDKWYVSSYASFRSQFTKTYEYDSDGNKLRNISKLASPMFMEVAIGMDYIPNKYFSMFLSPIAGKMTVVVDDTIASYNIHGNDQNGDGIGDNVRAEFGASAIFTYNQEVVKNVNILSVLKVYKNYLKGPAQNIDVDWQTTIGLKVTKFISANVFTHFVWDYDMLVPKKQDDGTYVNGRGIQIRDVVGVGFTYSLNKELPKEAPANVEQPVPPSN